MGKVATWQTVTVSALDRQGKNFTQELQGVDAVVFQHEFGIYWEEATMIMPLSFEMNRK